jgi:hypothetical protein
LIALRFRALDRFRRSGGRDPRISLPTGKIAGNFARLAAILRLAISSFAAGSWL